MTINYKQAKQEALDELKLQAKHGYLSIPCIMGGVGIGKTEMAASLAKEMSEVLESPVEFEAISVGETGDPTDITGVPWVVKEGDGLTPADYKVLWVLNKAAYQACETPTLLLFDDIDKANPVVVNSLLGLFVHRRYKDRVLHPKSLLMCAGNRTQDDIHARPLSESIKTRVTTIEVSPNVQDFAEYGRATKLIHPALIGFVLSKPEALHKQMEGTNRFPTPRGYRETSIHFFENPESKWRRIAERKLGEATAMEFWTWWELISKIDTDHILQVGELKDPPTDAGKRRMMDFAAIYALTARLNQEKTFGVYPGLEPFLNSIAPEMRVAFLLQLDTKTKTGFRKNYPQAAGSIMSSIMGAA